MGWTGRIIHHQRVLGIPNIQSKDFERMPYPWWVDAAGKRAAIDKVKRMIAEADGGKLWTRAAVRASGLDDLFTFPEAYADSPRAAVRAARPRSAQLRLPALAR